VLRYAAALGALGLAALVLAACGGDEDGPEDTGTTVPASSTPAVDERTAAEALLRASSLPGEDVPEGFTFQGERFLTNEETANEEVTAATPEDYERWGQILQSQVTYQREIPSILTGATFSLKVTTVLYRDEAGARNAFEFERLRASSPDHLVDIMAWPAYSDLKIEEATVSPLSIGGVGNDREAVQIELPGTHPDTGENLRFFGQLVVLRRGREIGSLAVAAVGSPHPKEEFEDMARALDERMKDALE
jgi:hypothetical protein